MIYDREKYIELHTLDLDIEWSVCGECRKCLEHGYKLGSFQGEYEEWDDCCITHEELLNNED